VTTQSTAVTAAETAITGRQPKVSTTKRSGTPATTPPTTPIRSAMPETMAYFSGGNQWLASLSMETKATATEAPIRSRPMLARKRLGAKANKAVPSAATPAPAVSRRRGPQRSAIMPVGICIAT
jgi:hypothetical protein